jgi:hypothetical protein
MYRVLPGTSLVIVNPGNNNDSVFDGKGGNYYIYKQPVEVAIVIPADWDERPGHQGELRPDRPCDLETDRKMPPTVSLSCPEQRAMTSAVQIRIPSAMLDISGACYGFSWQLRCLSAHHHIVSDGIRE